MSEFDDLLLDTGSSVDKKEEPPTKLVVRLTTSYWYNGDSLNVKKTLRFLRRQCAGYNFIHEDCSMVGVEEVIPRITNLDECKDGVYLVVTCNEWASWETPHIIEDYDYKLVPLNI